MVRVEKGRDKNGLNKDASSLLSPPTGVKNKNRNEKTGLLNDDRSLNPVCGVSGGH